VQLQRAYFTCNGCLYGDYPGDHRLGVVSSQTRQAQRLLCLAGTSWSFAAASAHLREFCGLQVAAGTVRNVCDAEAKQAAGWQIDAPAAHAKYRRAAGEIEFFTDGTCVNTNTGWREMRIGLFAKRPLGEPALPEEWGRRALPPTQARYVFAAIESSETFAARWPAVAGRLGIRARQRIDVLADGAKWIWERVNFYWSQATGTLDVYHALEHVAATGKALYGDGTAQTRAWTDRAREALLARGWPGIQSLILETRPNAARAAQRNSLAELEGYLRAHRSHLNYAERMAEGRSIGSGQVEGACKHFIGRRLKQTGARWRVERADRMAGLCALLYNDQWETYWSKAA